MLPHEHPSVTGDVTSRAAELSNVLLAAGTNERLDRIIELLEQIAVRNQPPFPMPAGAILDRLARMEAERNAPTDTRAFLDSLRGMSTEEIVAANRERNKRLKEAAT